MAGACVYVSLCVCVQCVLVHVCASAHVYVCVQSSQAAPGSPLGPPILCISGPSWSEVTGSYLYVGMLVREMYLFLKSFIIISLN